MNHLPVDSALRDRLFIIELDGYNLDEKIKIITQFSLPKIIENMGLKKDSISLSEDVAKYIINTFDEGNRGIRNMENIIKEIISKVNFLVKNKKLKDLDCITFKSTKDLKYPVVIDVELVNEMLKKGEVGSYGGAKPPFGMYI